MRTLEEYKEEIIQNMRSVGTYKESFANTIDAYARAMMDYDTAWIRYNKFRKLKKDKKGDIEAVVW